MGGQMGMASGPNNMRMTGPPRNAGMQQIPPSGPMMRAQVGLGTSLRFYPVKIEKWLVKFVIVVRDISTSGISKTQGWYN